MDEKILEILKQKPIVIPRFLFNYYKDFNITEAELIILIFIIDNGNKILYNPEIFTKALNIDKYKAMELINNLMEKKIISLVVEKNKKDKIEEYISLDLFYDKILNKVKEIKEEKVDTSNVFSTFENEFGRTLSPMEYEIIKGWLNSKYSEELIIEALKEATYNGVGNLRYIDKILYEWDKKGLKSKEDIIKDKSKYRDNKKEKVDIFDYNWLEDE